MLDRYATWCALDEWIHSRDTPAGSGRTGRSSFGTRIRRHAPVLREALAAVLFHKYLQWQIELQLEAASALPAQRALPGPVSRPGAGHRQLRADCGRIGLSTSPVAGGRAAGRLLAQGQTGASLRPTPSTTARPATGSSRNRSRQLRHGGALRIDHVMRFSACTGFGRHGRHRRRLRPGPQRGAAAHPGLESVRRGWIVGEDLGTVTSEMREALTLRAVRLPVLWFEKNERGDFRLPKEYPSRRWSPDHARSATLAGFWTARDVQARHTPAGCATSRYRCNCGARTGEAEAARCALRCGLLPEWSPRRAADIPELTGSCTTRWWAGWPRRPRRCSLEPGRSHQGNRAANLPAPRGVSQLAAQDAAPRGRAALAARPATSPHAPPLARADRRANRPVAVE